MAAQAHGGGQAGNRYENAVQVQGGGQAGNRYDDGDSAMARAGYQAGNPGIANRLGHRVLDPDDQRLRLDRIYQSEEIEEQGPPGPPCFGPRIILSAWPGHETIQWQHQTTGLAN